MKTAIDLKGFGRFSGPALLILASLAQGPKHGYAMMQDIAEFAGVAVGPGTLYGALSRLEKQRLIKALPSKERQRPYRLTAKGGKELCERLSSMQRLAAFGLARLATS